MRLINLLVTFLFAFSGHADQATKSLSQMGGWQLSLRYVQVGSNVIASCGTQYAKTLVSGIQSQQSHLEIQKAVQQLTQKHPRCGTSITEYLKVYNEVYFRNNAALVKWQQKSVKYFNESKTLKEAQIEIEKALGEVSNPDQVQVLEEKPGTFLLGGLRPADATELLITITKKDQPEANYLYRINNFKADQKSWKKKVYLRHGTGTYTISLLRHVSGNSYLFRGQFTAALRVAKNPDLLPSQEVQSDDPEIVALALQITKAAKTNFERLKAIHDWVAENIVYDYSLLEKMSKGENANKVYGEPLSAKLTLKKKSGICQEYSFLTAALLRAIQIPTRVIHGKVTQGEHAWNEAFVDNRWIILDTTWDAGEKASGTYFDPPPERFKDHIRHKVTTF